MSKVEEVLQLVCCECLGLRVLGSLNGEPWAGGQEVGASQSEPGARSRGQEVGTRGGPVARGIDGDSGSRGVDGYPVARDVDGDPGASV